MAAGTELLLAGNGSHFSSFSSSACFLTGFCVCCFVICSYSFPALHRGAAVLGMRLRLAFLFCAHIGLFFQDGKPDPCLFNFLRWKFRLFSNISNSGTSRSFSCSVSYIKVQKRVKFKKKPVFISDSYFPLTSGGNLC